MPPGLGVASSSDHEGIVELLALAAGAPAKLPVITLVEEARQAPELAVLSAMAHGGGGVETAVEVTISVPRSGLLSSAAGVTCFDTPWRP